MKTTIYSRSKVLVVLVALSVLNLTILVNYQYARSSDLTNDTLRPEKDYIWKYENKDLDQDWVFQYTLTLGGERLKKVANKDVPVLVINGTGKIAKWASNIDKSLVTDQNKIYIEREIDKNNLELIAYTQEISYERIIEKNLTMNYNYLYITYNITELTKPDNITMGATWIKKVIRTQTLEFKKDLNSPERITHPEELINSTFECDKIVNIKVGAGSFDTFRIVERQWIADMPENTIYWFYSTETKSVVKMERKNIAGKLVETEELMDFEKKTTDNNGHVTNNETSEDNENSWLDVQILLGISAVIIATVVIVFFMFRKQRIRK